MSMLKTIRIVVLALLPSLLASSCVAVDPTPDFAKARELVQSSTGRSELFDPEASELGAEEIDAMLRDGLSLAETLELTLRNNRELQAEVHEIGIAHADWVQSQLLSNPSLDILFRVPSSGGRSLIEAALGFELLELWRVPVRSEASRQHLEASVLRIARSAGQRLAESKRAYFTAVAAEEMVQLSAESEALATRSLGAVLELMASGAADELQASLARGPLLAAQLGLRTAHIEAAGAKRELAKMLSLARPVEDLLLSDALQESTHAALDAEQLVQLALAKRLDLCAIDLALDALEALERLERKKAWGDVELGPAVERPSNRSDSSSSGAAFSLTLPIFDQNQAQVARAAFERERMHKLREAAQVSVAQNVRSSAARVNAAANNLAFYRDELLPQAERSLELLQASYAAGRSTLPALLEMQRALLEAKGAQVTLRLEAAAAAAELEQVLGAPLVR